MCTRGMETHTHLSLQVQEGFLEVTQTEPCRMKINWPDIKQIIIKEKQKGRYKKRQKHEQKHAGEKWQNSGWGLSRLRPPGAVSPLQSLACLVASRWGTAPQQPL